MRIKIAAKKIVDTANERVAQPVKTRIGGMRKREYIQRKYLPENVINSIGVKNEMIYS